MKTLILSAFLAFLSANAYAADKPKEKVKVAECRDGTTMYAETNEHRGACASHGGVVAWADGTPVKSHARKTEYR